MLLPIEADTFLKERCYKKNVVRSFCFSDDEMVFALLTKVVAGHIIITFINIMKVCLKKLLMRAFYSRKSSFHYY